MAEPRQTPEPGRFDAFELWRQWYETNEQAWTNALKEMTTTQSYAEAQGKMLEVFLSYQKLMRDAMSTQLSAMNLPSRDDVARLGELVVGMEEKIDQLDETVDALSPRIDQMDKTSGAVRPSIDRLGKTVDSLTPTIDRLGETVNGLSPKVDRMVEIVHSLQKGMQQLAETVEGLSHKVARLEAQMTIKTEPNQDDRSDDGDGEAATETGTKPAAARANRSATKGGKTE